MLLFVLICHVLGFRATSAAADAEKVQTFALPAESAELALKRFSEQAGAGVMFAAEGLRGVRTNAVDGTMKPRDALARMLANTGLESVEDVGAGGFSVRRVNGRGVASGSGTIEGRVFNPETGEYLELVRVTVDGTTLETFTDGSGRYRLSNVPEGEVRVRAFRTGVAVSAQVVSVSPGAVVSHDINLSAPRRAASPGATVRLDEFVVATSKEMDNAAIAINTQRFAANLMNVVATDEFGGAAESKIGEVLKSLPGLSMTLGGGGEPYQVSIDGAPANNVPITVGGFNLSSSLAGTSRAVGLHQIAINTISRLEVSHTPTPESSGAALAGSVNMVPRSAFERARPVYTTSAFFSFRDAERSLERTPGPFRRPTHKIRPGFEFSAVVPVNKRFGFTLSGGWNTMYRVQDLSLNAWRGSQMPTNGVAFPDTTPDQPYLTQYAVRDGGAMVEAASFGATVDFQISRNDTLSFAFQWALSDYAQSTRQLNFFINRVAPGDFSPRFTRGAPGQGELRIANTSNDLGGNLYMPTLTYRHNGPLYQAEVGLGHSQSFRYRKDATRGYFFSSVASRPNVTISFEDNFYLRPRTITVRDASGAVIDPYRLDGYNILNVSTNALWATDVQQTAFANLKRTFHGERPLTLKAGIDFRRQQRDNRNPNPTLTFAPGTDTRASQFLDEEFSKRTAPYGFPAIQWTSNEDIWEYYQANPGRFTENTAANYTQAVAQSKHAEELISSAFVRGDLNLAGGRLKLVGGVRAEQTNVEVQGTLIDPTRNFLRDANGRVVLQPNGTPAPRTTDPLAAVQLTNVDRGLRGEKEYLRWFPSLNASFNVTDGFIARVGHYLSVGRPDFNQYGGNVTLPNTENPPGPNNRIQINNAAIKAWTARTTKVSLEYYFEPVGLFAVSAFQRDYENLFGSTLIAATPEFLGLYGLNPDLYGAYDVATQYNIADTVRTSGVSVNYKQALSFLPHFARGVRVFANVSAQRVTNDTSGSFTGYTPRTANWGVSLSREKFSVRMNWNYSGRKRLGPVAAGRGIEPGTFNWSSKRLVIDLNGEFKLTRRLTFFAAASNLHDDPIDFEVHGPSTPDEAQFRQRQNFGALWTLGIKGTF